MTTTPTQHTLETVMQEHVAQQLKATNTIQEYTVKVCFKNNKKHHYLISHFIHLILGQLFYPTYLVLQQRKRH